MTTQETHRDREEKTFRINYSHPVVLETMELVNLRQTEKTRKFKEQSLGQYARTGTRTVQGNTRHTEVRSLERGMSREV